MSPERAAMISHLESILLETPFPEPLRGESLRGIFELTGQKVDGKADVSQGQIAELWIELSLPEYSGDKVALMGYIAYTTLLIRLTKSFLGGKVSCTVFSKLLFDWTRYWGRYKANFGLSPNQKSMEYDNLVDLADRYPDLEKGKRMQGMVDDAQLQSIAKKVLDYLEGFWLETKKNLEVS